MFGRTSSNRKLYKVCNVFTNKKTSKNNILTARSLPSMPSGQVQPHPEVVEIPRSIMAHFYLNAPILSQLCCCLEELWHN